MVLDRLFSDRPRRFGVALNRFYRKVGPEEAVVRSGMGGLTAVSGGGIWVVPIFHRAEMMDLSVKRIEIARQGEAGLICRDNIRADIEVAFFVRVNNTIEDILMVAQSLGCRRASERQGLIELFDAKFSEALKTVGKHFDFVELYNERDKFKAEILNVIGTDLNGYVLDDCAIDFLEQTPLEKMKLDNILDAEGIKKITDLTAKEHMCSPTASPARRKRRLRSKTSKRSKRFLELEEAAAWRRKQKQTAGDRSAITSREDGRGEEDRGRRAAQGRSGPASPPRKRSPSPKRTSSDR